MSKQKQTNKDKLASKNQQPIFRSEDKQNPSFFGKTPIQTELKVGQPNDPYEQEANKISAQFLNSYDQLTGAQANVTQNGGSLQTMLQPKLGGLRVNRKIQRKLQLAISKNLQKNEANHESNNVVDSGIEQQINNSKGGGQAMDTKTKTMMEASFGADFSNVRIHNGSKANKMSQSLNAHAFTVGNDIYFNKNQYNPESRAGKGLLAHELTHVVQQGAAVQKKRKDFLSENAVQNTIGGKYAQNATLFRKEIAQFQRANPENQIAKQQQDVLQTQTVDTVQKKSPANTLRKYSGGSGGSSTKAKKAAAPKFDVTSFSTSGSGNARLGENAAGLSVSTPPYTSSAKVKVTGDNTEVSKWTIGYIQAVKTYSLESLYEKTRDKWTMNYLPMRDGISKTNIPWYHSKTKATKSGDVISESMYDAPAHTVGWNDRRVVNPNSLEKYTRKETFDAWLIARRNTGEIQYLKNIQWGFDFLVNVDKTKAVGSRATNAGAGMDAITTGNGKGTGTPVLTAPVANDEQTNSLTKR